MVQSLTVLKDLHEIPLWWSQQLHRHPVAQTHLPPLLTPPLHPPPLLTPLQALIRLRLRDFPPPPHHPHWHCLRPPPLLPPVNPPPTYLHLRHHLLHPAGLPSQHRSGQLSCPPPRYLLHNSLLPAKLRQVILPPPLHPAAWPSQHRSGQLTCPPPQYLLHNSLLPAKLRQVILLPPLHPAAWPSQPHSVQMLPLFPIMPELVAVLRPWAILASRDLPRQVCLQKPTPTASPG